MTGLSFNSLEMFQTTVITFKLMNPVKLGTQYSLFKQ